MNISRFSLPRIFQFSPFFGLVLVVAFCRPFPASANEVMCYPRPAVEARLGAQLGESPRSAGATTENDMIEVWVAPNGSWTLVINKATNGTVLACPFLSGTGWQKITPKIPGNDS